jgi:putative DNA primase/helicase
MSGVASLAKARRNGKGVAAGEDLIADAFSARFGGAALFDHDRGRWFQWRGDRWEVDGTGECFHALRGIARMMADGDPRLLKASTAAGAERFARSDPRHAVTAAGWDADPLLLGVPGGVVDLRTGLMRAGDPANRITKRSGFAPKTGSPELWLRFLHEACGGDADLVEYLRRWAGYCLTGLTSEHALLFGWGPGGNGKSVFVNILGAVMGDYAVTASMDTFTSGRGDKHPTDLAMLQGARLVTASETEEGRAWAESRIKQMTGGDAITARFMRQDFFTFQPQFKLLIIGNHAPTLTNVDEAMRRRFNLVSFTHRPQRPDRDLEAKLRMEGGRILQWAIEGCLSWQREGLNPPAAVTAATAEYFSEQDSFARWLEDCCELGGELWDTPGRLFFSWQQWCGRNGEAPGTQKSMAPRLRRAGFVQRRTGTMRQWAGVAVRERDG